MRDDALCAQKRHRATRVILVVEDDLSIGKLLVEVINEETPYKAIVVSDGEQALQLSRNLKPDLLLLDYQLPSMTGVELYDILHATQGFAEIPALFMSVNAPMGELHKRHLDCIHKPFELEHLLGAIENLLAPATHAAQKEALCYAAD